MSAKLGNDLGNLVSRTTAMIAKYRDGRISIAPGAEGAPSLSTFLGQGRQLDDFDLTGAIDVILGCRPRTDGSLRTRSLGAGQR